MNASRASALTAPLHLGVRHAMPGGLVPRPQTLAVFATHGRIYAAVGPRPHSKAWGPARSLEGLAAAPQTDSAVGPRPALNSSGPSALAEGQAGPPSAPYHVSHD